MAAAVGVTGAFDITSLAAFASRLSAIAPILCEHLPNHRGRTITHAPLNQPLAHSQGLEQVAAAQAALDCMLEGQDYAGALALLAELKALLEAPGLMGLQCVRHLPPRLAETTAAVERALAAEFLATLANGELARVVAEAAADAEAQPGGWMGEGGEVAASWGDRRG